MKFIPPLEISSKIMTLIEDAREELILVSPYLQITNWTKMKNCLERAVKRNVSITLYVREDIVQDYSFVKRIGIKLVLVKYLHAKLYLNEKRGIVTSQNMIYFSDVNSIDIGYETEKNSERKELVDFINNSITNTEPIKKDIISAKFDNESKPDKIELTDSQLEFIYISLKKNFPSSKLKQTSTYIFCGDILSFADVMIDRELTIKIRKSRTDFEQIIRNIERISNKLKNDFKINTLTTHKTFYYLTFIPADERNYKKIVQDYLELIEEIIRSEV